MVKITSVVSDGMKAKSSVAMVAALIAGERDPREIADLAKGPLRGKRDALAEALDGMFDSHHAASASSSCVSPASARSCRSSPGGAGLLGRGGRRVPIFAAGVPHLTHSLQ